MVDYVMIYIAGFLSVFALGFQSRNVNTGKIKSAALMSFVIAMAQGTLIVQLANMDDLTSKIIYGLSGSHGIVTAMMTHNRIYRMIDAYIAKRKALRGV